MVALVLLVAVLSVVLLAWISLGVSVYAVALLVGLVYVAALVVVVPLVVLVLLVVIIMSDLSSISEAPFKKIQLR